MQRKSNLECVFRQFLTPFCIDEMVEAKIVRNASILLAPILKIFYLEKVFDFNSHLELCISISTVYEDCFLAKKCLV